MSEVDKKLEAICLDRFHILGDGAYPNRSYILTPFPDHGNLNDEQTKFNKYLSRSRVRIENAFGLLKSRFGQLYKVHMYHVEKISMFIISCCVLHNLCIYSNSDVWAENSNPSKSNFYNVEAQPVSDTASKEIGDWKRLVIMNSLTGT